jgi:hypothetical protein
MDLLAVSYLLAILPTVAILVGAVAYTRRWLKSPTPPGAFVLGLAGVAMVALLAWSLQVPFFSTKSFYAFVALVPVMAFASEGMDVLMGSKPATRLLIGGLTAVWVVASIGTYWIAPSESAVATAIAGQWGAKGDRGRETSLLRAVVRRDPEAWGARVGLAETILKDADGLDEATVLLEPQSPTPATGSRLRAIGLLALKSGELARAGSHLADAVRLEPDNLVGLVRLATVVDALGDRERATQAWREVLAVDPTSRTAHTRLSKLCALDRDYEGAMEHAAYAERFR